jgi:hypothetical protein
LKVLSQHLAGGTAENHYTSRPRSEPRSANHCPICRDVAVRGSFLQVNRFSRFAHHFTKPTYPAWSSDRWASSTSDPTISLLQIDSIHPFVFTYRIRMRCYQYRAANIFVTCNIRYTSRYQFRLRRRCNFCFRMVSATFF